MNDRVAVTGDAATAGPAAATDTHIVVDSVSVSFPGPEGAIIAVDEVLLDIRRHEFICIMGRSGCGKTTLLNVIAGFVSPTTGEVRVAGERVISPGPDRAVVFQSDAVFPWMSVEKNIGFSLKMRGVPKAQVRQTVDRYIGLVHLKGYRKAWPRQLSDGMKKRVDLARGYAADPDVLLLDEPFGALDVLTKERLQEELQRLALTSPRTTIFVTHDVEEALFLGDRVVLMSPSPGRVRSIYEPGFAKPRDLSVKLDPDFIELRGELTRALQEDIRG